MATSNHSLKNCFLLFYRGSHASKHFIIQSQKKTPADIEADIEILPYSIRCNTGERNLEVGPLNLFFLIHGFFYPGEVLAQNPSG